MVLAKRDSTGVNLKKVENRASFWVSLSTANLCSVMSRAVPTKWHFAQNQAANQISD
jgi:hypothetical protein